MNNIHGKVLATIAGVLLALSGQNAASADSIDLTVQGAAGLPGSVVHPTVTFPLDGFTFDSLTLTLTYDASVLSFQPGASTVSYNGQTSPFNGLPNFFAGPPQSVGGGQSQTTFVSYTLSGPTIEGPLVWTGAFELLPAIDPRSVHQVTISGLVSTGQLVEEPAFSAQFAIAAVPEPETWLLWIGGLGLLAAGVRRRQQGTRA